MNIYIIPAILALVVKFTVVFYAKSKSGASRTFMWMISIFAFHNMCEVILFFGFFNDANTDYLLKVYYLVSIAALLSVSWYVTSFSNVKKFWHISVSVFICLIFALVAIFSDLIIAGTSRLSYIVTALRGEFYWTFQVLSLVLLLSIIFQLYVSYTRADSHMMKMRSLYTAIALTPHFLAVIVVMGLMNAGVLINGTVIFPIATTLFIVITLASEYQHRSTDIRRYMPFSEERRTTNKIMEIFSNYARDDAGYRDSVTEIERLLVLYKLDRAGGNATSTAEQMGMPRSSLYSIFNRLKIKVRE